MKLYRGNSYWKDTLKGKKNYESLKEDIKSKVVVIGGGMSGMLSAFRASEKYDTVLLEGEKIGEGSSCLNTGLIQYMSDDSMKDLANVHGEDIAVSFYDESVKALDNIEDIVKKLKNNPDFLRNSSFLIASEKEDFLDLKEEAEFESEKLNLSCPIYTKEEMLTFGVDSNGAMVTENDVELNPYKFVNFTAEKATEDQKLKIYEDTKVISIDFEKREVHTENNKISYDKLVIATGYNFLPEVREFIPDARLIKTFAAISEEMPAGTVNKKEYMLWETQSPYFYYRKSITGNVIIGGGDKDNLNLKEDEMILETDKLKKDFYNVRGIELNNLKYRYSAIFGESESGLPYIGPHPNFKDVYIVHGVGGNGTVYSSIASMHVNDFIEGKNLSSIKYLFPSKEKRNKIE